MRDSKRSHFPLDFQLQSRTSWTGLANHIARTNQNPFSQNNALASIDATFTPEEECVSPPPPFSEVCAQFEPKSFKNDNLSVHTTTTRSSVISVQSLRSPPCKHPIQRPFSVSSWHGTNSPSGMLRSELISEGKIICGTPTAMPTRLRGSVSSSHLSIPSQHSPAFGRFHKIDDDMKFEADLQLHEKMMQNALRLSQDELKYLSSKR